MKSEILILFASLLVIGCVKASAPISPRAPQVQLLSELRQSYVELQGVWTVYHAQLGHIVMPEKVGSKMHFEGNRFHFGGDTGFEIVEVDNQAVPNKIDFWSGRSVVKGIYRIEGDTLTVCTGPPGARRPSGFRSPAFSRYILTEAVRSREGGTARDR